MEEFMRKFVKLNGKKAKILLEHCLFDKQVHYCEELHIINDNGRIGVRIKDNDIFVYKQDVEASKACDNIFIISDGRLTIIIIVNEL